MMQLKRLFQGFTLIELLVVVAIIAILAGIAVPNFLESQTRTKVTRSVSDMRAVAIALEAYHVDNSKYPPCDADFDGTYGLEFVTKPINYISESGLRDLFVGETADGSRMTYGYCARNTEAFAIHDTDEVARWWVLSGVGPDRTLQNYWLPLANDNEEESVRGFTNTIYDVTNGTLSEGNIYRSGGYIDGPGASAARMVVNSSPALPSK